LIDTYDTERAAHRVVDLARELKKQGGGKTIGAVRIDSGDLAAHAREVRQILDAGGCQNVRIVFSGGLDEYEIERLVQIGTPVDVFGVGTSLDVSADAPSLDLAYKLQEYAGEPRRKRSPGKFTWPGAKQVFRSRDLRDGGLIDQIALHDEQPSGVPLLTTVMSNGHRTLTPAGLGEIRDHCVRELQSLPPALRALKSDGGGISVQVSNAVQMLAKRADDAIQ
jgi:nicotinate phosphoribosyltransferase